MGRWAQAMQRAKDAGYSLAGFYHTSAWMPHWKEIVEEQLLLMDGRRPVAFFEGPYPMPPVERSKGATKRGLLKTGAITWGKRRWASVLDLAHHLHVTVAGKNKADLAKVRVVGRTRGTRRPARY